MCLQRTAAPDYFDRDNDRGFITNGELAFHPQKLMFYGNVGSPLALVDGTTGGQLQEACLLVVSADKRYVLCYA